MKLIFLQYPKCSTCQKAHKWLKSHQVDFELRQIVDERPTVEELKLWVKLSGLPLKKFFNTSGVIYKEMKLKDRLADMTEDEQLDLLAQDGKLVKRPLIVGEDFVLVGFSEEAWNHQLSRE